MGRRTGRWSARIDWLELVSATFGVLFLVLALLSTIATVTIIVNWGNPDTEFAPGSGLVRGIKSIGIVFFPLAALLTGAVGWWLLGDHVKRLLKRLRHRGD